MTKKQFIERLENELIESDVKNINDILNEYKNHFEEGKRVGKSEEEIAESLGSPEMIASEYTNKHEQVRKTKKGRKKHIKIIAICTLCVWLVIVLSVLVPFLVRELNNRTITIVYDNDELSLMSVEENQITEFRFLDNENELDKGEEFYLCIEQKGDYKVKSIKIDGKDRTSDLLSYSNKSELEELPNDIKNLILSNEDSVFIKITVKDDMKIEIISE